MDSVQRFAIGGLVVTTIVETLMLNYALSQQVSKTDDRIKATYETIPSRGIGLSAPTRAVRQPDGLASPSGSLKVLHKNRNGIVTRRLLYLFALDL
jgi:hypothetical protein